MVPAQPCISKSQDAIIKVEVEDQRDKQIKAPEDADGDVRNTEAEDPNATDYSSSFDGTVSGTENCSGLSDAEVESCFYGDNDFAFDGFGSGFPVRKKKLTNHWRSFIRPLMWRCKWTELKIKEFQSKASKYGRQLAVYDQRKQLELDQFTLRNFDSKSLPSTVQSLGRKAMKRRKRKRVEDTTDLTAYMSKHNLFSYHENKKSDPDGTSVAEGFSNPVLQEENTAGLGELGIHSDCSFFESKDDNDSLVEILHKIEAVHSHVHKLKSRLVMVIAENGMKFSSSEHLGILMPCDGQTSSACSPTFSACNGDTSSLGALYTPNQHMLENDVRDFVMPESMLSSYGEAISIPDIIESTVSLLSTADVTIYQSQIGDSCEAIMDNVLQEHYQADEVKRHTPEKIHEQTTEKHHEPEGSGQEESSNPSPIPVLEPDLVPITSTHQEQSRLTSSLASEINFPKSKRKRGERKAGSGGWNR
ncbi:uncharacterized protein LOC130776888 [Actinidia eriantha]|uniref:uncharacterized protein LOC130776888 n=1 Tax=Actinidia eriantha TaxID=165200 RepID=UPI00258F9521|nr:uncharacterized protein LOC130776888 [Actinidia eriantha]XP_057491120.1 uncharacterized protein LOC130776888 [Actinidia eriantha]XP_057491130.1 uncharacterized protein LOC130776888 [Actinidia eriantha]XP_057491138.1 uncharacterized protein LOC130776888 [Actinidia eriantha]XP_057491146.1 uncharacterized protein LOC130776888 [Actinidia eriantha]